MMQFQDVLRNLQFQWTQLKFVSSSRELSVILFFASAYFCENEMRILGNRQKQATSADYCTD